MIRAHKKTLFWMAACILCTVTVVLAGRTGLRSGQNSSLYESKPNVLDSGGGRSATSTCFTVVSIGQPAIGSASSTMYKSEAGFFTSAEAKPEVTGIAVTNTNDSGEGSLRWAIDQANGNAGPDTILFNIPDIDPGYNSDAGVWTIRPQNMLPFIDDDGTVIDGTSQTLFGGDTNPFGPEIEMDGTNAGNDVNGFRINSSYNVVKGLVINRYDSHGIFLHNAHHNRFIGNYLGTDATASTALANRYEGIQLNSGSSYNTIGGIAHNERNVISGNDRYGILVGADCSFNWIVNNFIGTDRSGSNPLGNGEYGVQIGNGTVGDTAHNNIIGPDNSIAFNGDSGIRVRGPLVVGNTITRNSIHSNIWKGIELWEGNMELDAPVITTVTDGTVTGTTCPVCTVEVFSDDEDEGKIFEGRTVADGTGHFSLIVNVTGPNATATATDFEGNTSEFSEPFVIGLCSLGDVNCDGNITPGDALCAFWRAILGSFQEECECDCSGEAAEINCDGNITPGDALCIFWRAILGDWTEDCQCPTAKVAVPEPSVDNVIVHSATGRPGECIVVPIVMEHPQGLDAFALDVTYPEDLLDFQCISPTDATQDWIVLEGVRTGAGAITVGGFHTEGIFADKSVTLVEMTFGVKQDAAGKGRFDIVNLTDGVAGARIEKGNITIHTLPTEYSLSQNYPNPFNPTTSIQYSVKSDRFPPHVSLKIFNLLGQEVVALVDEVKAPGVHTVEWDASDLASGVYFSRLTAGEYTATRRMVLMK
jgi:hypothetical protein